MKKTQKRLGNKGFSLVELIVVIAIMAVLVGVLAPTLIRNVEKSRKSKDDQNLDAIKEAIQVTLQDDKAYAAAVPNNDTDTVVITISSDSLTINLNNADFKNELDDNLKLTANDKLTSNTYKGKQVVFSVDKKGTVKQSDPANIPTPTP